MRIVFWQNCLSPHQIPYIEHIKDDARIDEVIIAAGENVSSERKQMGWNNILTDASNKYRVFINPGNTDIENILKVRQDDSIHLFSGIRAFGFVFKALKRSLKYNIRRGLVTERPNAYAFHMANGKPLWLHKIRFMLRDRKCANNIQFVFAIGVDAEKYYSSVMHKWNVIPFIYCTNTSGNKNNFPAENEMTKFIFVGSLSSRKSPMSILKAYNHFSHDNHASTIDFVGGGSEKERMLKYIKKNQMVDIQLLGIKEMSEISSLLNGYDILILPSH